MKQTVAWMVGISIVMVLILIAIIKMQQNNSTGYIPENPTPTVPYVPPTEKPTEEIKIVVDEDGLPTAVLATPTDVPTSTPTPTVTPMPTVSPTAVIKPTNTPNPTNTPKPTRKPTEKPQKASYGKGTAGRYTAEHNGEHKWKPWTNYTSYTMKSSQQYKLQQVATDCINGIRIVKDPEGEMRYCVALGTAWAGGSPSDIGRCVDLRMSNGWVLKCVLADVKKVEHTKNQEGRYGAKRGELVEFIVNKEYLFDNAKKNGDCSYLGAEFNGEVVEVIVYDLWIKGFGKE